MCPSRSRGGLARLFYCTRSVRITTALPPIQDLSAVKMHEELENLSRLSISSSRRGQHQEEDRNRSASYMEYDWQLSKTRLKERGKYLLCSQTWADCQFTVGEQPNTKVFECHRLFLAMASPVFSAMFYGNFPDQHVNQNIPDVHPDAFEVLLEYIYTDEIRLQNFDLVCNVCYAAQKYMLPVLVDECKKFLLRDLYPRNACKAYEFAKFIDDPNLRHKSWQMIQCQTIDVIRESTFEDIDKETLKDILSMETTTAHEALLFDAMLRWAGKECERKGLESNSTNKRVCVENVMFLIRFLAFSAAEFAAGPVQSGLLTQDESFAALMNISSPGSWSIPDYMNPCMESRKSPDDLQAEQANEAEFVPKVSCKRAIMPEPHCLNTSILDCSMTFTVDKDICIHGIEIPSQVTDVPDNSSEMLPIIPTHQSEYNELLYAQLQDVDGNRLTYTHFTAKVPWNSMIEIIFNRPVYIKANQVYRIGTVLNKVGWYPMGVCTRRVDCEGCFFTFCVGQPNDTSRDGLIRSIIFSF